MNQPEAVLLIETPFAGCAVLTLNRPRAANALSIELRRRLTAEIDRLAGQRDVRVLILTGAGRGFCAGQDLEERKSEHGSEPPDLAETIGRNYNPLVMTLRTLSIPVVSAVNGVAAGAGASVALGEFHPGVLEDRSGAGFRRHLVSAETGGRCTCTRDDLARRSPLRGAGRAMGHDLALRGR